MPDDCLIRQNPMNSRQSSPQSLNQAGASPRSSGPFWLAWEPVSELHAELRAILMSETEK